VKKAAVVLATAFLVVFPLMVVGCGNGPWTYTGDGLSPHVTGCLAYDSIHNVLYAGTEGYGVWEYDGKTWVTTPGSEKLDMVYALAFDTRHKLLYAGCYNNGTNNGGVWKYDGSSWTSVGGEVKDYAVIALACDPSNNFLFASYWDFDSEKSNGIWKYNGTEWKDTSVPVSAGGDLLFDSTHTLLYATGNSKESGGNSIWKYDGVTWTSIKGISNYGLGNLAYDSRRNMLYAAARTPRRGDVEPDNGPAL
jgi:hypothetical protein